MHPLKSRLLQGGQLLAEVQLLRQRVQHCGAHTLVSLLPTAETDAGRNRARKQQLGMMHRIAGHKHASCKDSVGI